MEEMNEFRRFDLVSDHSDHHYADNKAEANNFTNTESGVYKRIMREWKILEQNLPESIYVCAYERRIDLLRAVIVGVAGTPYHDGLFFFDIQLPINYPRNPPKLRYRSFGYLLNLSIPQGGFVLVSSTLRAGIKREMGPIWWFYNAPGIALYPRTRSK